MGGAWGRAGRRNKPVAYGLSAIRLRTLLRVPMNSVMMDGETGLWTRDLCFVAGLFDGGRSRWRGAQVSAAFSNRHDLGRFAGIALGLLVSQS